MDLFNTEEISNELPYDGEVYYHNTVMSYEQSKSYYDILQNTVAWRNDEAVLFGKRIITKRKVAWYGNKSYTYTYSNTTKQALPWTKELLELKQLAEDISKIPFNSCLLNLYHDGSEGMSWHSDDEKSLGTNTIIASLSLGAERRFSLKHKVTKQRVSLMLEKGSVLIMKGATQTHWLHMIPKSKKIVTPRINLTFRTIIEKD